MSKYVGGRIVPKHCGTWSSTKTYETLSVVLYSGTGDSYAARAYHGKMDKKIKSENQNAFIEGATDIMVATSAFGMGVDKKDVGMVIHYDISDSLENYVQEAGRAGRDQSISAECFVLYDENDLNKHFILLNQTKISIQEIQQVWRAIKELTRKKKRFSSSALEIARAAGWDESVMEVETRVKTAINALEEADYVKRGDNIPHVYADSMLVRSVMEAEEKIDKATCFTEKEKEMALRIVHRLIKEDTRVDYIADHLGMEKEMVIWLIDKLRDAGVLADDKDLTAYVDETSGLQRELNQLHIYTQLENFILQKLAENETDFSIKKLNEEAQESGIKKSTTDRIIKIINFWVIKKLVKKEYMNHSKDLVRIALCMDMDKFERLIKKNWNVAEFILHDLDNIKEYNESYIKFSVLQLVNDFNYENQLILETADVKEIEYALLYLSKTGVLKLEGGFLVTYNALTIERLEMDNKIRYKADDYKRLKAYYDQKVQMIHIVGEYAKKVTENYEEALQFVDDYFQLEYGVFIKKYFRGERGEEIKRNITPKKFQELFGTLSPAQLQIIKDKESPCIVVAAGPGSGKTKILVHKLASLLLMEDVKHEQMLMLTFSRAAATEFKQRLIKLIGHAAGYIEIKTFHSYCFDLLGRVGNLEHSENIVADAVACIENGEVESSKITKTVVVIDEAQDMDANAYALICALLNKNDDIRIIAVGDDDQNIYGFRHSDSKYMKSLLSREGAKQYELIENFRSKANLVDFTNQFANQIKNRMKSSQIVAMQTDYGKINMIEYSSKNLVVPVVQKMSNDGISKGTCVMTWQNDTALQVAGLFKRAGINVRLIQSSEEFKLSQMRELRYFYGLLGLSEESHVIEKSKWQDAKQKLKNDFGKSTQYELCCRVIESFEKTNPRIMFASDWRMYLTESKLADFYDEQAQVCVSTMHKSKGHEFDHVVILLDNFTPVKEEEKRLFYVAITRAKKTLAIHFNGELGANNGGLLRSFAASAGQVPYFTYENDDSKYDESNLIIMQLGMKDVALSNFYYRQRYVERLMCGYKLKADSVGCYDIYGNEVLRFSNKCKGEMQRYLDKGYRISKASVNMIIYWKQQDRDDETLVVLPEIELMRNGK